MGPKPTLRSKRNRTKEKHKKEGHLQRKNVSILNMPKETTSSIKTKTMKTRDISN